MKILSIFLLTLFIRPLPAHAQHLYVVNDASFVRIEGTSTMHDWKMETRQVAGNAGFVLDGNEINGIRSLRVTIPAESLKSGRDGMDKNAYKALRTDDHKEIIFVLTRVGNIEKSGTGGILTCEGKLTIAGKTNVVRLNVSCAGKADGSIHCTGEETIAMTAYGVEPPSFMFGSVRTGDELAIMFDVLFTKSHEVNLN